MSHFDKGSFFFRLGLQVKTHKPQQEITCRNLHRLGSNAMRGLSKWLADMLTKHARLPHCLIDSFVAAREWNGTHCPEGSLLATLDIKDSFLSGDACGVLAECMTLYEGAVPQLVREALFLLLDHRFVITQFHAKELLKVDFENHLDQLGCQDPVFYKCVKGSGTGLPHSGRVAKFEFLPQS